MASVTTTTPAELSSARLSEHYTKKFLEEEKAELRMADVATKFDLPKKAGSMTMRMYRKRKGDPNRVSEANEINPISTFNNATLDPIDVTLKLYEDGSKISNTRLKTDLLNQLDMEVKDQGEAAAEFTDTLHRDELFNNICTFSGMTSSGLNIFAGTNGGLFRDKTEAEMEAQWDAWKTASANDTKMLVQALRNAVTYLKRMSGPKFDDGCYTAILPPEMTDDLQTDEHWRDVNVYGGKEKIFNGEIGKIAKCKVVETNVEYRLNSSDASFGTYDANGDVFVGWVVARQALGTVKLSGETTPWHPKVTILNGADKADPNNKFTTAAWLGYNAAKLLNINWAVAIFAKSTVNYS